MVGVTMTSNDGCNEGSNGSSCEDAITGGDSNDRLYGGSNDNKIFGNGGSDYVSGGFGDDTIYGGAGNDTIRGEYDDDLLYGGAGNDLFEFADPSGEDTVFGGSGFDEARFYSWSDVSVTYSSDQIGTYTKAEGAAHGTLQDIEKIQTFSGDDQIDASSLTSDVTVYSGSGQDSLIGGTGDDVLYASSGDNQLSGGDGNDLLVTRGGRDTISGGDGDDTIGGGSGDDEMFGGQGNDSIYGGDGNDLVDGGAGDDTLTGGTGDDTFALSTGSGGDIITDFDVSDSDNDGVFNDQLDVSGLQNPDGSPVRAGDVTVEDDGAGNAKLIFPEGESLVLQGVSPGQISSTAQLNAAGIPCFTPGAMIATPYGERAIETLQVGDKVVTRDHGMQTIQWIGQRAVVGQGDLAPIIIKPGVVTGLYKPIWVSPQHRMLFTGHRAELLFGESEVLVAAKHLVDGCDVIQDPTGDVVYIHLLFDRHEVIYANGAATESFHPGSEGVAAVDDAAREELFAIFPELRSDLSRYGYTARRCLRSREALMVRM